MKQTSDVAFKAFFVAAFSLCTFAMILLTIPLLAVRFSRVQSHLRFTSLLDVFLNPFQDII